MVMLSDPVLAFIKGYHLCGSIENLKRTALLKFDADLLSMAKRLLWDSECSDFLSAAGLNFQSHHNFKKQTLAAADLDDALIAFGKVDEDKEIPEIDYEATY